MILSHRLFSFKIIILGRTWSQKFPSNVKEMFPFNSHTVICDFRNSMLLITIYENKTLRSVQCCGLCTLVCTIRLNLSKSCGFKEISQ